MLYIVKTIDGIDYIVIGENSSLNYDDGAELMVTFTMRDIHYKEELTTEHTFLVNIAFYYINDQKISTDIDKDTHK